MSRFPPTYGWKYVVIQQFQSARLPHRPRNSVMAPMISVERRLRSCGRWDVWGAPFGAGSAGERSCQPRVDSGNEVGSCGDALQKLAQCGAFF